MTRFVSLFLVLGGVLSGCSNEWVERQIPDDPPRAASSIQTNGLAEDLRTEEAEQDDAHEESASAPVEKREVTIELPAARSRHVTEGAIVEFFVTTWRVEGTTPEPSPFGVTVFQDVEVAQNACDEQVCALTVYTEDAEGLLAVAARADMTCHVWTRADGERGREEVVRMALRDGLKDLELHQELHTKYVEGGRSATGGRRMSVELALPPLAVSRLREGMEGELVGVFLIDTRHHLATVTSRDDPTALMRGVEETAALTLLQQVRVEGIRVELGRVVVVVDVQADQAALLTLAQLRASRIDFIPSRPGEEPHEVKRRTPKEVLMETEAVIHGPRRLRVKRRPREDKPEMEIVRGR